MINDLIMRSLTASLANTVVPIGNMYYDRAQQPSGVDGFPYMRVLIENVSELRTQTAPNTTLNTYEIKIEIYTCQKGSNDQMTDQGTFVRAMENILNFLPPNTPWHYVTSFVHCIRPSGKNSQLTKEPELYQGVDVMKSTNVWNLLVTE
jgi:hypothetical protein